MLKMGNHQYKRLKSAIKIISFISAVNLSLTPITYSYPSFTQSNDKTSALCEADLKTEIDAIVQRPEWRRSRWGISVQTLDEGKILYEREANQYFVPASNVKLLTTAVVLLKFGRDYRFRTPVYAVGTTPNLAQVTIVGQGDPSITTSQLITLAETLKKQGIDKINALTVQDSTSAEQWLNPSWEWSDLAMYFAPPVSQLNLNQNTVTLKLAPSTPGKPLTVTWSDPVAGQQWRINNQTITSPIGTENTTNILPTFGNLTLAVTGQLSQGTAVDDTDLAIPNPPRYFLDSLQIALQQQGIIVNQTKLSQDAISLGKKPLAVIESPSLLDLITDTNHDSINLYAEALLSLLAKSESSNLKSDKFTVLKSQLQTLGIDPTSYQLADGSGLSRQNWVSPAVFVQLLRAMARTAVGQDFRRSFAIAGKTGTLKNSFLNTPLIGKIQAKTGTLAGVYALSGYLDSEHHSTLVFSIILNQSDRPAAVSRQAIQDILLTVNRVQKCDRKASRL